MSIPEERPTDPVLPEGEEVPTLRAWEVEAIQDLETQLSRLRTGHGCKACRAAGQETVRGGARLGDYVRACGTCGGTGLSSRYAPDRS